MASADDQASAENDIAIDPEPVANRHAVVHLVSGAFSISFVPSRSPRYRDPWMFMALIKNRAVRTR